MLLFWVRQYSILRRSSIDIDTIGSTSTIEVRIAGMKKDSFEE